MSKKYVLTAEAAQLKINRLALEIAEFVTDKPTPVVLIGIKNNGIVIAHKIAAALQNYLSNKVELIEANLNKELPAEVIFSANIDFNGKHVIICDDVSNSGKTLLYVLKPILNFYPKAIQTLVLVERMHKAFPIKPDYVGLSMATTLQDNIVVEVSGNEITGAYIQ